MKKPAYEVKDDGETITITQPSKYGHILSEINLNRREATQLGILLIKKGEQL